LISIDSKISLVPIRHISKIYRSVVRKFHRAELQALHVLKLLQNFLESDKCMFRHALEKNIKVMAMMAFLNKKFVKLDFASSVEMVIHEKIWSQLK
jgi:hypothetical protein